MELLVLLVLEAMKRAEAHVANVLLELTQQHLVILVILVLVENGQVLETLLVLVIYSFESLRIIFFSSLWSWMYLM